jgi:predicted NBD/HSP70 family sugar kinase
MASGAAVALSAKRLVQTGRDSALKEKVHGNIEEMTAKIVAECAREGDEIAKNLMLQAANYIGIALADAINMLDPQLVIFGGGMSRSGDFFIDAIKEVIQKRSYVFGMNRGSPRFALADFGEDMNAVGAAALVLENTLETT